MIIGMQWQFALEMASQVLITNICHNLIHTRLSATYGLPNTDEEWDNVLPCQNLITDLLNQLCFLAC
jgi:hypothetical protein|tara:strand:+ start:321 stop:521 length:201 start_codon:yes stop_codon:yes gene_type:complete